MLFCTHLHLPRPFNIVLATEPFPITTNVFSSISLCCLMLLLPCKFALAHDLFLSHTFAIKAQLPRVLMNAKLNGGCYGYMILVGRTNQFSGCLAHLSSISKYLFSPRINQVELQTRLIPFQCFRRFLYCLGDRKGFQTLNLPITLRCNIDLLDSWIRSKNVHCNKVWRWYTQYYRLDKYDLRS